MCNGLQNSLDKLETYSYDWQLTVNIKKTKYMTFQNTDSPPPNIMALSQLTKSWSVNLTFEGKCMRSLSVNRVG